MLPTAPFEPPASPLTLAPSLRRAPRSPRSSPVTSPRTSSVALAASVRFAESGAPSGGFVLPAAAALPFSLDQQHQQEPGQDAQSEQEAESEQDAQSGQGREPCPR
jgi:hypothetical protein